MKSKSYLHYPMFWAGVILCLTVVGFPLGVLCLGFALDVTNIQNEIANCNTVWDKYKNDLLTGASDPATAVPACIEELKAAGLDTVIEEAQKQVDEFFAN